VYVAFGSSVVAALDFAGRLAWRREIVPHAFDVTLGTSPILYCDTLLVPCAMADAKQSRIIAYDKNSGDVRWEHKMPGTGFGHSTPVIVRVRGRDQMLFCAGGMSPVEQALQSFDPATGSRLWWCWGGGESASPAYVDGFVYFDSGRGGPGVAVSPTGDGDISKSHIRWKIDQVSSALGSPIVVGDHIYRLQANGTLRCWHIADGRQVYAQRLTGLSTTWASPVADTRGNLFFANAGTSCVVRAGPAFKLLAVNQLGDSNHGSPAVVHGKMFLVGMENVYCIGAKD
jgi:outer membrane protein assembly factor BamB